jgi:hypothetical protein
MIQITAQMRVLNVAAPPRRENLTVDRTNW